LVEHFEYLNGVRAGTTKVFSDVEKAKETLEEMKQELIRNFGWNFRNYGIYEDKVNVCWSIHDKDSKDRHLLKICKCEIE
jgi:hypothetical protein